CQAFLPDLDSFIAGWNESLEFVWLQRQDDDTVTGELPATKRVAGVVDAEVFDSLDIRGTPFVHVIDETGTVIAKSLVNSIEDLEALAWSAVSPSPRPTNRVLQGRGEDGG
ncbi:MAG: hypothetical protein WBV06_16460, partial [Acidimicrobiia bacterium]